MASTGQQYAIAAGDHAATVVEVGAGLRSYTRSGVDVTVTYGDDVVPPKGCGAVLVPWPNRLRRGRYRFDGQSLQLPLTEPTAGNAIHGLGRWSRWVCLRYEASSVTMALDIVPQPGWPFEVRVEVTYALDAVTGLHVSALARNTGLQRAPFGAGFHPYVALGDTAMSDVALTVPALQRLVMDESSLPVGTRGVDGTDHDFRARRPLRHMRLDDAFTGLARDAGRATVEVRTAGGGARVWCDESFPYVQLYTLEALADGRGGVAVEPMTCPPDAFNSGTSLVVLEPGDAWSGHWGIEPL